MARVLLLIVLIWLIYWVVTRLIAFYQSKQDKANPNSQAHSGPDQSNQQTNLKIVQCSRCGCHVPENESHIHDQQVVCNSTQCGKP